MTPEEIELEKVLNEYAEKFDRNYPLVITSLMSTEDIIKDVRKYIEKGKPKPEPRYRRGEVY